MYASVSILTIMATYRFKIIQDHGISGYRLRIRELKLGRDMASMRVSFLPMLQDKKAPASQVFAKF